MVNNSTSLIAFSRCRPPDPSEHLQQRLAFFLLEARTWHAKHTRPSRSDLSSPIPLREFAARADAAANAKARELGPREAGWCEGQAWRKTLPPRMPNLIIPIGDIGEEEMQKGHDQKLSV
jgi:hypothetical protein